MVRRYQGARGLSLPPRPWRFDRWAAPDQIGWVWPAVGGTILAGLRGGLHRFDPASGGFALLAAVEPDRPGNPLNDAAVAPVRRLWFGSMDDAECAPTGTIYRADARGIVCAIDGICIANGPAVSPTGGRCTTTTGWPGWSMRARCRPRDGVRRARADPDRSRRWLPGRPDGGCERPPEDRPVCWLGVRRYSPDGELPATVRLPVANVTKIAFGGPSPRTVYATTARKGLSAAALAAQPGRETCSHSIRASPSCRASRRT